MRCNSAGLDIIRTFEGLELEAYPDPGTGGSPWTIGYGHTRGVQQFQTCTEDDAEAWLAEDVERAERAISKLVRIDLTGNQFSALVPFVFNVGAANFEGSTLLRKLNRGDIGGASLEFLRWNRAAGRVLDGLTRRRAAEQALFNTPGDGEAA